MLKIYFICSGTPTPTKNRFGTCYILKIGDEYLMFDCGPAATHKLVKMGLFPTQIDYLFFSHHHFDHNVDYPCFLLCRWDQSVGKENILQIWGPPPTKRFTDQLIGPDGAFNLDWKARIGHTGSQDIFMKRGGELPRLEPKIIVNDISSGIVIKKKNWTITASTTQHIEPWMQTIAYRIESDEGSIVLTSDSGICNSVKNLAQGADTLLIHCWDNQEAMGKNETKMIMGTIDAAIIAKQTGVKRLILAHQGPEFDRPGNKEKGISDISKIFEGEIIFSKELMFLEI